ncbi:hypothetical protein D3C80_2200400 [compost metagenome]
MRLVRIGFVAHQDRVQFGQVVERHAGIEVMLQMVVDVVWGEEQPFPGVRIDRA